MSRFDDILGGPAELPTQRLTADEFGALVGVSDRSVRELARKGILNKDAAGRYDRDASIRSYCTHLREAAAGRGGSMVLTKERTRVAKEQADAAAMKNAITRGEMVAAKDVEREWGSILRDVRSAMLAVPSRVQQILAHLTAHDVSEIDHAIRNALKETAR